MQSLIEEAKIPGETIRGFALLNPQETETVIDLPTGKSKNLGWTSRGKIVSCLQGSVWVTQEQDLEDYILEQGESFMITVPGRVIVQALEDSSFSLNHTPRKNRFTGSYEKSIFK